MLSAHGEQGGVPRVRLRETERCGAGALVDDAFEMMMASCCVVLLFTNSSACLEGRGEGRGEERGTGAFFPVTPDVNGTGEPRAQPQGSQRANTNAGFQDLVPGGGSRAFQPNPQLPPLVKFDHSSLTPASSVWHALTSLSSPYGDVVPTLPRLHAGARRRSAPACLLRRRVEDVCSLTRATRQAHDVPRIHAVRVQPSRRCDC